MLLAKLANVNVGYGDIKYAQCQKQVIRIGKIVLAGEKVIISKNNEPLIELVIFKKDSIKRKPGALKGKIWSSEDCWDTNVEIFDAVDSSEIFQF